MQYQDGSLISLIPEAQGGGITYTHTTGVSTHFGPHDDLPLQVRDKMTHIKTIERLLKQTPTSNSCGSYTTNRAALPPYDLNCLTTKTNTPLAREVNNNHAMRFFR